MLRSNYLQGGVRRTQTHGYQIIKIMRQTARQLADCFHALRKAQLFLHLLSPGDVEDGARSYNAIRCDKRSQTDFRREFCSVLPECAQFPTHTHWPGVPLLHVAGTVCLVRMAKALRQENLDGFADQLSSLITKHGQGLRVGVDDPSQFV